MFVLEKYLFERIEKQSKVKPDLASDHARISNTYVKRYRRYIGMLSARASRKPCKGGSK